MTECLKLTEHSPIVSSVPSGLVTFIVPSGAMLTFPFTVDTSSSKVSPTGSRLFGKSGTDTVDLSAVIPRYLDACAQKPPHIDSKNKKEMNCLATNHNTFKTNNVLKQLNLQTK